MNHYELLNIHPQSTIKQIKSSFKKLIKQHHPDKCQATLNCDNSGHQTLQNKKEVSMKIIQAYQCLIDAQKRKKYDHQLKIQQHKQKIFSTRHKDIISLSQTNHKKNTKEQSQTLNKLNSFDSKVQDDTDILGNADFSSDGQQEDFTVFVCQQCFGQMQVKNDQLQEIHLKQLSFNCQHCGLYMTVVQ